MLSKNEKNETATENKAVQVEEEPLLEVQEVMHEIPIHTSAPKVEQRRVVKAEVAPPSLEKVRKLFKIPVKSEPELIIQEKPPTVKKTHVVRTNIATILRSNSTNLKYHGRGEVKDDYDQLVEPSLVNSVIVDNKWKSPTEHSTLKKVQVVNDHLVLSVVDANAM